MKLSFRQPKMSRLEKLMKYFRENPGCKWSSHIPIENKPIQYLEIGVHKGTNLVDIAKSYCQHPDSRMYCVDPWMDYDEYPEYKGRQDVLFGIFKNAVEPYMDKLVIHRGFSYDIVPAFQNNFFDIVFVDGNHETEFVYRDGKMAFDKVKSGGYIIFDDYNKWEWSQTVIGIDKFLNEYSSKIKNIATNAQLQLIIKKL